MKEPIQSFFKKSSTKRRRLGEKSIVRPIFSYYGRLIIDDAAILSIIKHIAKDKDFDYCELHTCDFNHELGKQNSQRI